MKKRNPRPLKQKVTGQFAKKTSAQSVGRHHGRPNTNSREALEIHREDAKKIAPRLRVLLAEVCRTALRIYLDRVLARYNDQPISVEIPPIQSPGDLILVHGKILRAATAREITITGARELSEILQPMQEVVLLEERLRLVEEFTTTICALIEELPEDDG